MTQSLEATQVTGKNAVSSFFSALKSGVVQGESNGNLFASLLAESKNTSFDVQAQKMTSYTASDLMKQKTEIKPENPSQVQDNQKAQRVERNEENKDQAPLQAKKNDSENKQENLVVKAEDHSSQEDVVSEKEDVAVSEDEELVEKEVVKEDVVVAQENLVPEEVPEVVVAYSSFLTALNSLNDKPKNTENESEVKIETGTNEKLADVVPFSEGDVKKDLQARQGKGEGKTEQIQKGNEGEVKAALENALAVKAGQRNAQEEAALSDGDALSEGAEALLAKFESLSVDADAEENIYSQNKNLNFKDADFEKTLLSSQQEKADSVQSPLVGAVAGEAVKKTAETLPPASAGAKTGSVSEAGSTNVLGGVRSSDTYAFASQLSAARVTKGGAAGLPTPVEQIAVQINRMAKDGKEEMTINLKPAELGKIQVKLEFSADHKVQAMVTADNQNSLDLLMKDQSSLSRALTDAGLQVDSGSLQFSLNENQQNKTFEQERLAKASTTNEIENDNEGRTINVATETYYITPRRVNFRV